VFFFILGVFYYWKGEKVGEWLLILGLFFLLAWMQAFKEHIKGV
jgi:hypothetical protein